MELAKNATNPLTNSQNIPADKNNEPKQELKPLLVEHSTDSIGIIQLQPVPLRKAES